MVNSPELTAFPADWEGLSRLEDQGSLGLMWDSWIGRPETAKKRPSERKYKILGEVRVKIYLSHPEGGCEDGDYSSYVMDREHSNAEVNRAGDFIAGRVGKHETWELFVSDRQEWERQFDTAFGIVTDWRNIHGTVLKIVSKTLAKRAVLVDEAAIIAQRLKRYPSIKDKLIRSPINNLTTMQDIAGCRAVLETVAHAYELKALYELHAHTSGKGSELIEKWTKDYIQCPKPDGYRSIHLILRFRSDLDKLSHCNGLRVEVQLRSRMQHAWAMAVETASAVTNQALKSGIGEADWKRFFWLVGDIIASTENGPLICAMSMDDLRTEAAALAQTLKVIPLLENMQHVFETFSTLEDAGEADLYLLELDSLKREITYHGYPREAYASAVEAYSKRELETKDRQDFQVVLVSVASLNELRAAYPSYFLDSSGFIEVMRREIFGQR
jgi:ppGpp synthetase/RelA/SpoT-type nucleotidyltranferase